ncbi:MAG TPA: hypothetical protein DCE42_07225 [Myxococcales bacterium]|nr:hypothetical protein [Deltaproteobacteria bacterium]MBU52028.1 hypothetical protein [Deltaproteobacteria bacterium]HAA54531.1 hypothetical protein [Myxococcales bacterium]
MNYTLVIPAAGRATRAMTFTGYGATPKPLVSVGGKTVFGLILEEARQSGLHDLAIIVSDEQGTEVYRRYFDPFKDNPKGYEATKKKLPEAIIQLEKDRKMNVDFVFQDEPLGFGHAVGLVYPTIKDKANEGILIALGDDLICGGPAGLSQLIDVHKSVGGMVFMVEEVSRERAKRFGVMQVREPIDIGHTLARAVFSVEGVEEKPQEPKPNMIDGKPRYFAVAGRYLLEPEDLEFLHSQTPTKGKELDFTPLFRRAAEAGRLTAILPNGRFHTVGNALDVQKAGISFALQSFQQLPDHELVRHTLKELLELGALRFQDGHIHLHEELAESLSWSSLLDED